MSDVQSLNHSKWECKYHMTWIPKCRRKSLYGGLRKHLGEVFRDLARRKECEILEGHLMEDHIHMLASIPPKYAVSQVIGYFERQKCHSCGSGLHGQEKELQGAAFLGQRLPCLHSGTRRRGDPEIYQRAGAGRSKARPARDV